MDREVNGSNSGGVKYFSTRPSFESNASDISRFMLNYYRSHIKLLVFTTGKIEHIEFF